MENLTGLSLLVSDDVCRHSHKCEEFRWSLDSRAVLALIHWCLLDSAGYKSWRIQSDGDESVKGVGNSGEGRTDTYLTLTYTYRRHHDMQTCFWISSSSAWARPTVWLQARVFVYVFSFIIHKLTSFVCGYIIVTKVTFRKKFDKKSVFVLGLIFLIKYPITLNDHSEVIQR